MDKLDYLKKMINQEVWVIDEPKSWIGTVESVLNLETLVVKNIVKGTIHNVSIFDIRKQ